MQKNTHLKLLPLLLSGLFLGLYGNHVALLDGSTGNAVEVYPLRASLLPPADQESLKKGIPVPSPQVLDSLLEDYLS